MMRGGRRVRRKEGRGRAGGRREEGERKSEKEEGKRGWGRNRRTMRITKLATGLKGT